MIKGYDIIQKLGFSLPGTLSLIETDFEIYFVDKHKIIHGRLNDETIRWSHSGLCLTHLDDYNLFKPKWYEIESNFPCLVKNSAGVIRIALKLVEDKVYYEEGIGWDMASTLTPVTLEEAKTLIIEEGKWKKMNLKRI